LRHALDADHIAAIDNVTRKLMHEGRRPLATGLWFALGHSTVVVLAGGAIASAATALGGVALLQDAGRLAGTLVSAGFLFVIALANLGVAAETLGALRRVRRGLSPGPAMSTPRRARRPLALIGRSWQMFPLGMLFALGFDTASEVGLLGLSASQASAGLPVLSTLVFPALFTAGMTLVDTLDGVLMLGAYGWALGDPIRKLRYDLVITSGSVAIAGVIGGIETAQLVADRLELRADLSGAVDHLGYAIVAFFALTWLGSWTLARLRR
jgi:high-affinity nickel-transport protein